MILNFLEPEVRGFPRDVCRSMVAMLDWDNCSKLGLDQLLLLLNDIAKWKV